MSVLLLILLPYISSAQADKVDTAVIEKFIRFYDNKQVDSIRDMYIDVKSAQKSFFGSRHSFDSLYKRYGKIKEYEEIGDSWYDLEGSSAIHSFTYQVTFARIKIFMELMFWNGDQKFTEIRLTK